MGSRVVPASSDVTRFVADLIAAPHPTSARAPERVRSLVRYGSGPRGGQAILLAAKARALLDGRVHGVAVVVVRGPPAGDRGDRASVLQQRVVQVRHLLELLQRHPLLLAPRHDAVGHALVPSHDQPQLLVLQKAGLTFGFLMMENTCISVTA